jgi:hypothetical protein
VFKNNGRARRWPALWGAVGWALVRNGHYWLAKWWMRDHAQQDGLKGWMLSHLARALVASNELTAAVALCRRILAMPADGATAGVRLLLAPMVALDDPETARREIAIVRTEGADLDVDDRFLAGVSDALVLYAQTAGDGPERRAAVTRAFSALWSTPGARPSFIARRIYEHVVDRLQRAAGAHGAAWRNELRKLPFGF